MSRLQRQTGFLKKAIKRCLRRMTRDPHWMDDFVEPAGFRYEEATSKSICHHPQPILGGNKAKVLLAKMSS